MERARREKWNLLALDLGVDLSTPAGEFMANVLISIAQWERRIIGDRTREALAVKKTQGVKLGRPTEVCDDVRERIIRERTAGWSLSQIAAGLNRDRIPTGHGGAKWYGSSVRAVSLSSALST
jgi:DNA invertase Pin-like site-specific DNA recombinase